jgi:L-aminopeptidase/D-esterase-like protein
MRRFLAQRPRRPPRALGARVSRHRSGQRRVALFRAGNEPGPSYNLGVLVQSNFGIMRSLRISGVPVGEILAPDYTDEGKRVRNAGSIICVVATDAPLLPSQITRLCKRAALGFGRVGSFAAHASGEIVIGFSTANKVPRSTSGMTHQIEILLDDACDGLYEAVVECTEDAIVNSLCMADNMRGQSDRFAPALPLNDLTTNLNRHHNHLHQTWACDFLTLLWDAGNGISWVGRSDCVPSVQRARAG